MATNSHDLLSKVKQRFPQVKFPADAAETLERVQKFLTENLVQIQNDATHQVLGNYADWWESQTKDKQGAKFLAISEEYNVEELNKCIATMYELGAPLTLGEKRTEQFTLLQDIVIRGSTAETSMDPEKLVGPDSKFLKIIGKTMVELYPKVGDEEKKILHLFVLDGSGLNRDHGKRETVIRLVWGGIIVNKSRALSVNDILVSKMCNSDCPEVMDLAKTAKKDSEVNEWKACFQEGIFLKNDPIRMIFNDSVSKPPLMKPEERPFKPLHIYELEHENGKLADIKPLGIDGLPSWQWPSLTAIRQPGGTEVTEWEPPKGHTARQSVTGADFGGGFSNFNGAAAGRNGTKVHMRTIGGSPTDKPQRGNSGRPQEDKSVTHQRIMRDGTVEDFVEKMKQVFGNEHGDFQTFPAEKKAIWTQKSSQTNVEFREPNHTVYVTGKEGSVRQILAVLGQFLESVPEGYTGVETSSRVHTRSFIGSKAPSKVFEGGSLMAARTKPTSVTALSIANKPKSASTTNGVKQVPYRRKVTQDCESEGSGELELKVGEIITVQEDPDAPEGDLDRWVFGKKEKTGETGWFALGYTRDTEE